MLSILVNGAAVVRLTLKGSVLLGFWNFFVETPGPPPRPWPPGTQAPSAPGQGGRAEDAGPGA